MALPDFQSLFKPLLGIAADGKEHSMKEAREIIAKRMHTAGHSKTKRAEYGEIIVAAVLRQFKQQ